MKSTSGASGSSAPLQVLRKNKSRLTAKRTGRNGYEETSGGEKIDRIREYMEQKFYEQFVPKRDKSSRIRKLALDKATVRRTQGNRNKCLLEKNRGVAASGSESTKQKNGSRSSANKLRKPKANGKGPKSSKEICTMVLQNIRDL